MKKLTTKTKYIILASAIALLCVFLAVALLAQIPKNNIPQNFAALMLFILLVVVFLVFLLIKTLNGQPLKKSVKILLYSTIAVVVFVLFLAIVLFSQYGGENRIELVVESFSANKVYDGTALQSKEFKLNYGQLNDGHRIEIVSSTQQVDAGTVENQIVARVLNQSDIDVTSLYKFTYIYGTLTVTKCKLTIQSDGLVQQYDDNSISQAGSKLIDGKLPENHNLNVVTFGEQKLAGTSQNLFTATITDGNGNDATHNFEIVSIYGELTVEKLQVAISTPSLYKVYDGTPLSLQTWEYASSTQILPHHTIFVTVSGSQTDVGVSKNKITEVKVLDGSVDVTSNYEINRIEGDLIVSAQPLTLSTPSAQKTFDGSPLTDPNWSFAEVNRPVAGQNISVTVSGSQTQHGKSANFISDVKIVDQQGKDVTSNYLFTYQFGELSVTNPSHNQNPNKPTLNVKPVDIVAIYQNGRVIVPQNEISGLDQLLQQGFTYKAIVNGSLSSIGKSQSQIAYLAIFDKYGKDVTNDYSITYHSGKLEMYVSQMVVVVPSLSKVYDGTPLTANSLEVYTEGNLILGHKLKTVALSGSLTNVGQISLNCTVEIVDSLGNDVTHFYNVVKDLGTLTVLPRKITIVANSLSKVYDGKPLTSVGYHYTGEGSESALAAGHTLSVTVEGSQTEVGKSQNLITSVKITDKNGVDVTQNYSLDLIFGWLTVNRK